MKKKEVTKYYVVNLNCPSGSIMKNCMKDVHSYLLGKRFSNYQVFSVTFVGGEKQVTIYHSKADVEAAGHFNLKLED